jgi:GMP synthase (glutamine-hydrolysing)
MQILIVQNFPLAPAGVLGECITARHGSMKVLSPTACDRLPKTSAHFDGLIILGGPMHAEDDDAYPHLQETVQLVYQFSKAGKPILGVCLGAQLVARAFGQRVQKHHTFELGFLPVSLTGSASTDPLFKHCPSTVHLMEWHFDSFDLPAGATLLMSSETCQNQAYRIGRNIYGFQFHLEVTRPILQSWLDIQDDYVSTHHPDFPEQLHQQIEQHLDASIQFCWQISNAWLNLVEERKQAELAIITK